METFTQNQIILFKNERYVLEWDTISIIDASQIDYSSYADNNYLSVKESESILKNIHFVLYKDNEKLMDSKYIDIATLDFHLGLCITEAIKSTLFNTQNQIKVFKQECKSYLNKDSSKMPPELLIAQQIYNHHIQMSLFDLKSISSAMYERVLLAIEILNDKDKVKE